MFRFSVLAFLLFCFLLVPVQAKDTVTGHLMCGKEKKVFKSVVARYVKSRHQVNILLFDYKLKPNEVEYWKGINTKKFPGREWVAQFRIELTEPGQPKAYDATLQCKPAEFFQRSGAQATKDFGKLSGTPGRGERVKLSSKGKNVKASWSWSVDVEISPK